MTIIVESTLKLSINEDNTFKIYKILKELERQFSYGYFEAYETDSLYAEVNMGFKWGVDKYKLLIFCKQYNCSIIGVAYDFSMDYVTSFNLN